MDDAACRDDDLTRGWTGWLLWRAPLVLIAGGLVWPRGLYALWIPAFLVSGAGCVWNARRCGRLHCHVTGPLYLLAAAYLVLAGTGAVPFEAGTFLVLVFGAALAAQLAERRLGRYRSGSGEDADARSLSGGSGAA